jgi:hypothetical protein
MLMKTLIAAATLILSVSAAMAQAPCEAPRAPACQKACAVMGAKFVLSMRDRSRGTRAPVQAVRMIDPVDSDPSLASAQRLASFAGLSLDYIDALTVQQISRAIVTYCPK